MTEVSLMTFEYVILYNYSHPDFYTYKLAAFLQSQ